MKFDRAEKEGSSRMNNLVACWTHPCETDPYVNKWQEIMKLVEVHNAQATPSLVQRKRDRQK
jgi:hypothetical protein